MSEESSNTTSAPGNPPTWLDAKLIERALRSDGFENKNITVKDIAISRATAPGDNYGSVIYRVHVTLADGTGERSLLVKTVPEGEAIAQAVVETGAFEIEGVTLAKCIPAMQALLDESCPGRFPPFAARCLLRDSLPVPLLVLEDLKPQGFRLAERHRGLGLRHSLLAIRTLARFHAASAALLERDPTIANELSNPFRRNKAGWETFIFSAIQMSADVCRKWPGYEVYADTLERFKPRAMEILTKIKDPVPGKFNVILHGDYWTNNMMFHYDESGKLNDLRVVDLQISHHGSPSIDLLYFLNTSLSDEVSERHEDLLLREYYVALTETLSMLGLRAPSFKELMADMDSHGTYCLIGALGVWPLVRTQKIPDMNAAAAGDASGNRFMYESELMKRWLQRKFPEYTHRGWLEF